MSSSDDRFMIDRYIFTSLFDPFVRFCCMIHLHPNIITLSGTLGTLLIWHFHNRKKYGIVAFLIFYKWFSDALDGPVARKCEKQSKLGGFLDTMTDYIFSIVMLRVFISFFWKADYAPWIVATFLFGLFILPFLRNYTVEAMYNHSVFKQHSQDDKVRNIVPTIIGNLLLFYVVLIVLYLTFVAYYR